MSPDSKFPLRPLPILSHRRMPSLLEYLSYNCNFMGILAGPTCSYNDYVTFIEGTCYQPRHQENANGRENGKCKQSEPSPKVAHSQGVEVEDEDGDGRGVE